MAIALDLVNLPTQTALRQQAVLGAQVLDSNRICIAFIKICIIQDLRPLLLLEECMDNSWILPLTIISSLLAVLIKSVHLEMDNSMINNMLIMESLLHKTTLHQTQTFLMGLKQTIFYFQIVCSSRILIIQLQLHYLQLIRHFQGRKLKFSNKLRI